MKTSKKGIELIKKFEGWRSKPYLCAAQVPTIGFGFTRYADGTKVTMKDKEMTPAEGDALLIIILSDFEKEVKKMVKSEINQQQFDALVSFTFNFGPGKLKTSTLLKKVNLNPKDASIKDEFAKWVNAGGKKLDGLVKRRLAESQMYYS